MPGPKIAIIGAGPSGLTFASLLQQHEIPFTVYEAETSRHVRDQGGTLDLHPDGGQQALKEAGLFEEFKKHARYEGETMKLIKYDGTVLWDENEVGNNQRPKELTDRPEIDRVKLRGLLLDSIHPDSIHWNRKLDRAETETTGKYTLHFKDNSVETGIDLLVGADGAWSKVRPLLTHEKPFYSGITSVTLWANDAPERYSCLSKAVGCGSCFMFDEGRAVLCQRQGNGTILVYACVRQPETWIHDCGIDWKNRDAARAALVRDYFNDCGKDVKRMILESRDELIARQLYMLPVGIKWESRPGVTLVGDAAHLMTPYAGVGVNVAMADSLDLARALIARKESFNGDNHDLIAAAVKEYENRMFVRAKLNMEKTFKGLEGHFSATGIEEFVRRISGKENT